MTIEAAEQVQRRKGTHPPGWATTSLGNVCLAVLKVSPSAEPDNSFRYIDISSIDNRQHSIVSPQTLAGRDAPSRARQSVRVGDVLFSTVRTYLENIALVPPDLDGSVASTGFCVLRPAHGIDPKFIFYGVLRLDFLNALAPQQRGSSYPAVRDADVKAMPFPVAPTAEQRRIVAAIEEQFSRIDAGVWALQRARRNLQRMRAAVLQAAVTGRLVAREPDDELVEILLERISAQRRQRWNGNGRGRPYREPDTPPRDDGFPCPEHWGVASLEQLTDPVRVICYGILKPRVPNGTIPYVEVRDLARSALRPDDLNKTSEALHREFSRSTLKEGDVLLAIRGSYDRAGVVSPAIEGANISRDVARIAPLPGLDPRFLSLVLTAPQTQAALAREARGVGVKGINIADIRRMAIPLPSETEQQRIVARAEHLLSLIDGLQQEVNTTMRRGTILRRAVLSAGFAGGLVPQDSSDEPAEILLDRIKAAREADKSAAIHPRRRSR